MTKLVQIGNSQGVRIPKDVIEQARLKDCEIKLCVQENGLLLTPVKKERAGWDDESLQKLAKKENLSELEQGFLDQDLKDWHF